MREDFKVRRAQERRASSRLDETYRVGPGTRVFGVDVQTLKELVQKVGPLAQEFRRHLRDRLGGR